jgi:hypothetical protein
MMSAATSLFDIMELRFKELIDMISPVAADDNSLQWYNFSRKFCKPGHN